MKQITKTKKSYIVSFRIWNLFSALQILPIYNVYFTFNIDLADNNYFKENEFINYISYLQYFKRIEYLKFITYSRSIIFLDLLQYDFFRDALGDPNFIQVLIQKVEEEWLEKKPIEKDFVMNNLTTVNGVSNLENDMNKMDISN